MSKLAIITGMGMDARTLTHILLKKGYRVILTHRRNTVLDVQNVINLFNSDVVFPVFMDIIDQYSIEQGILNVIKDYGQIDEFYHLAGQSHVGDSFKCEVLSINTNGLSAYHILEALRKYSKSTRFYFASTSECFGGDPKNCPFRESSPQELRSPYSLGKNLGANITKYFRQTHDMYACFGWLFNHSNIYRHNSFYFMRVIREAIRISLGKEKELKLGNLNFWRDEHLSDFGCEMMWKMLNNPLGAKDYVVGNGKCNHGEEYLDAAFKYVNLDWKKYVKLDESRLRPNEVVKLLSDPTKAVTELGWKENRISLKQHVEFVADYVYQQEKGEKPIRIDPFEKFPIDRII